MLTLHYRQKRQRLGKHTAVSDFEDLDGEEVFDYAEDHDTLKNAGSTQLDDTDADVAERAQMYEENFKLAHLLIKDMLIILDDPTSWAQEAFRIFKVFKSSGVTANARVYWSIFAVVLGQLLPFFSSLLKNDTSKLW